MIYKKRWTIIKRFNEVGKEDEVYVYTGWFLFGFIPLYIIRDS